MHVDTSHLTPGQHDQVAKFAEQLHYQNQSRGAQCDQPSGGQAAISPVHEQLLRNGVEKKAVESELMGRANCGTAVTPRSFAPPRSIGWAIKQLHNGARVTRRGWNGPRQWLALRVPDGLSANTLPYIYIRTVQGDRVPWVGSQTDILAADWQIA